MGKKRAARANVDDKKQFSEVSAKALAFLFGTTQQNINNWRNKGAPQNSNQSFDLKQFLVWREKVIFQEGVREGKKQAAEQEANNGLSRLREAKARQEEIKLQKEEGKIIDIEDIKHQASIAGTIIRDSLTDLTARLPERLAGMTIREIAACLEEEIKSSLDRASEELSKVAGLDEDLF